VGIVELVLDRLSPCCLWDIPEAWSSEHLHNSTMPHFFISIGQVGVQIPALCGEELSPRTGKV
jgi:hypothetical protein